MQSKTHKADFRFKQFSINQDQCAMKVGVEAVAFGAWCHVIEASTALDIGSGTGILSLMLAQRNESLHVQGIEIDQSASEQANENFQRSPWGHRLNCENVNFLDYSSTDLVDLIVSNPPFFKVGIRSATLERSAARFEENLPFEQLISRACTFLKPKGKCCFMHPLDRLDEIIQLTEMHGLNPERLTKVQSTANKPPTRIFSQFRKTSNASCTEDTLQIYSSQANYTETFRELTQEFYLDL
jgi:tRNA1Val (adenine37-N6)-methyltransferase